MNVADCVAEIFTDCRADASQKIRSSEESNSLSILNDPWANQQIGHRLKFFEWPQQEADHWAKVPRYGDLLVGFYLAPSYHGRALNVRLEIGSKKLDDAACYLEPGQVTFALDGQYLLPLISMQFSEVRIQLSDLAAAAHCKMVIAYLQEPLRIKLTVNSWHCELHSGSSLGICGGLADMLGSKDHTALFVARTNAKPLPAALNWRRAAKREWQAKIDADLMAAAWHPKRMAYWLKDVMDDDE